MKTAIVKLSNRVEKVEKSGGNESGSLSGEITSSQVSDRISEYLNAPTPESYKYDLTENSIFQKFNDYIFCLTEDLEKSFSLTIEYNSQEKTVTNADNGQKYKIDNLEILVYKESFCYSIDLNVRSENDIKGTFKVKNITLNGVSKPDETITFEYNANKEQTDMTSERLMTANAVQGYVLQNIGNSQYFTQTVHTATYNIILCKYMEGQMYHGLFYFMSSEYEICFALMDNIEHMGYLKLIGGSGTDEPPIIQTITWNNQNYVSICITHAGAQSYFKLFTLCCLDKNVTRMLTNDEAQIYMYNPNLNKSTLFEVSK